MIDVSKGMAYVEYSEPYHELRSCLQPCRLHDLWCKCSRRTPSSLGVSRQIRELKREIIKGDLDVVKRLLQQSWANMNLLQNFHAGRTFLHLAAEHGHSASVTILLDERVVDVNVRDDKQRTPLHTAVRSHRFRSMPSLWLFVQCGDLMVLRTQVLSCHVEDNFVCKSHHGHTEARVMALLKSRAMSKLRTISLDMACWMEHDEYAQQ